jgi:hypothetical protein
MRDTVREQAVLKRYGKEVEIVSDFEVNEKGEVIRATCEWKSRGGKGYTLIEELKDGLTEKAILKENGRERLFDNHLVAEVNLIDLISEE